MVEGSFATATNDSPMPTARAPTPILRKLPALVPTRWPPTDDWASAGQSGKTMTASAMPTRTEATLEVIVDSQPPARRRPIDAGVSENRVALELGRLPVLTLALLGR